MELFVESLYSSWGQQFKVKKVLAHVQSDYQDILVFESYSHGRVLALDGCIQITEADEFIYQEMISHVPLLAHGSAERVLIVGAGDGGVLRRVLMHSGVGKATMVEIDGAVIRVAREHLAFIAQDAWEDARADVIVGDGIEHVARAAPGAYDVIIVDSTDPVGVGQVLFTERFYADCARVLGADGILVNQCGAPFMQGGELRDTSARRARAFSCVTAYTVAVPTYVGGLLALGFSAQRRDLHQVPIETLRRRADIAGVLERTRCWTPECHAAAFALPPYIAELLPD